MNRQLRSALQAFVCAGTLAGFWIACVSTLRPHEILIGAAAVVFATLFSLSVIRTLPLHFTPTPANLAQIWRVPGSVLVDTWVVTLVLAHDLMGRPAPSLFRAAPWRRVADNGLDTAARTLAVACATASPNLIVVGIDCRRRQLLFHQLHKTGVPLMIRLLDRKGPA